MVSPLRTSLTQRGAVDWLPGVLKLMSPADRRRWNGTPLVADDATSMKACGDEGESVSRTMTPALVQALIAWIDVTRAVKEKLPLPVRYVYWNASVVPQTSAPAPVTVNVPLLYVPAPVAPVAPTSLALHPAGRVPGGGAAVTVMVTSLDVVAAPASSVAFAVRV